MARTFRALRNPVRGARVVGHGKNTLSLIIETDRGSYQWDIKPIFPFEVKNWIARFKENWRSALKRLIRESEQSSTSKLNPSQTQLRYGKIVIEQSRPQKLHPYKPTKIHPVYYRWRVYLHVGMTSGPSASGRASSHRVAYDEAYAAYQRLVKNMPRTLFNSPDYRAVKALKVNPSGWKWKLLSQKEWHGEHTSGKYIAVIEKVWRRWHWRIMTRDRRGLKSDVAETFREAMIAIDKWEPKPRMLFNSSSDEWQWNRKWQHRKSVTGIRIWKKAIGPFLIWIENYPGSGQYHANIRDPKSGLTQTGSAYASFHYAVDGVRKRLIDLGLNLKRQTTPKMLFNQGWIQSRARDLPMDVKYDLELQGGHHLCVFPVLHDKWVWLVWGPRAAKIASGSSKTLEAAQDAAVSAFKRRARFGVRMLFNPRGATPPGRWKNEGYKLVYSRGDWIGEVWDDARHDFRVEPFKRFMFRVAKFDADRWTTGRVSSLKAAKRAVVEFIRRPPKPKSVPRMLFNPAEWLKGVGWQQHGSTLQRPVPTGLLQVARSGSGSGFIWTYWQHVPKTDQYQERIVDWGFYKSQEDAKKAADKWYMKRYKGPIMLFNKVSR